MPLSLGSNPGEGRAICECIEPLRHEDTLNSRRAASPLVLEITRTSYKMLHNFIKRSLTNKSEKHTELQSIPSSESKEEFKNENLNC
ncbi:hypothetical protein TNCV_4874571 [Trichonephila clavipes]|nr:hypothetical protein TNCV_4874571 [Trichonephila clavipes]